MKKAFTLAEILVTLAIIGVVAALTIPAVVHKYQQHVLYTQFINAYNTLSTAFQLAVDENGASASWFTKNTYLQNESDEVCYFKFAKYLNKNKECGFGDAKKCFASKYKFLNGGNSDVQLPHTLQSLYTMTLNDGMSLEIYLTLLSDGKTRYTCMFYVDTNGQKGPNVLGRDLFQFYINKDFNVIEPVGFHVWNMSNWYIPNNLETECKTENGYSCGAYLLQKRKMDY